jgi:hypothetical protein
LIDIRKNNDFIPIRREEGHFQSLKVFNCSEKTFFAVEHKVKDANKTR